MAEFVIPEGFGIPLVDLATDLLPAPTVEAITAAAIPVVVASPELSATFLAAPAGGSSGQALLKTVGGTAWGDVGAAGIVGIQNREAAFRAARIKATTLGNRSETLPDVTVGTLTPMDSGAGSAVSLGTVTATASTDTITTPAAHGLAVGDMVFFGTPSVSDNLSVGTAYYVRTVPTTTTVTLSTSSGGALRDITADATHTGMWRRQRTFQGSGLLNPAYRFLGATAIQASGTFPGNNYVGADSTDATYTPGTRIGPRLFATTEYEGSALDVLVRNDGDGRGRIYVDGREVKRWVPADFTAASITSGNIGRFSLTFTAAKRRRISIAPDNPASWIIGLDVQPGKPIFFPTSNTKGPRVMIAGDSFGEGTGASAGDPNMVQWLQWHMGWDDIWNTSSGGTGYFADGPRTSLSDRYVNDIIDLAPNTVIIPLGINDQTLWGSNLAGTQAAMQTVWDGIRTALPSAEIVVVGPWPNNGGVGVTAALIAMDAWMQAQCATRGIQFISPIQDGVTFVTSDGVHPDSAGHELLGAWLAGRLSLPYTR